MWLLISLIPPVEALKGKYLDHPPFYSLVNRLLGRVRQRVAARTTVRRWARGRPQPRIRIEFGEIGTPGMAWRQVPIAIGLTPSSDFCYGGGRLRGVAQSGASWHS
jgi:hypothetical protein